MECSQPKWILVRGDSGLLFWRREKENKKQVKFRYHVEVVEFRVEEDEGRKRGLPLVITICLILIATVCSYHCFQPSPS